MIDYTGKVALITGGASGAGFGQVTVFAEAGCKIAIADIRPPAIAEATAKLREQGAHVHGIALDVTDRAAYGRAADEVEKVFGKPPELLFNTAGVNAFGPVEKLTYDDFDWLLGVNLGGVVNGMVTFVPRDHPQRAAAATSSRPPRWAASPAAPRRRSTPRRRPP